MTRRSLVWCENNNADVCYTRVQFNFNHHISVCVAQAPHYVYSAYKNENSLANLGVLSLMQLPFHTKLVTKTFSAPIVQMDAGLRNHIPHLVRPLTRIPLFNGFYSPRKGVYCTARSLRPLYSCVFEKKVA